MSKNAESGVESEDPSDDELNEQTNNVISVFKLRKKVENDKKVNEAQFKRLKQLLTCPICLDIFQEPVYIKDCSHRFCKQCIERYIRGQERKSCPTCRKKIGTKRQLRVDENITFIMSTIFEDIDKYIRLETITMKKELELMRLKKQENPQKEQQTNQTTRKSRLQKLEERESRRQPPPPPAIINTQQKLNTPIRKKVKTNFEAQPITKPAIINHEVEKEPTLNVPTLNIPTLNVPQVEIVQQPIQANGNIYEKEIIKPKEQQVEQNGKEELEQYDDISIQQDSETMHDLKTVVNNNQSGKSIIISLLRHPEALWIRPLERNFIRIPWVLHLKDIATFISLRLNIKEYSELIEFYLQEPNGQFRILSKELTIYEINKSVWDYYKDVEIYDEEDLIESVEKKEKLFLNKRRQLYFDINFSL